MTARTVGEEIEALNWRALMPFVVGAGVYVVILSVGNHLLGDPDSYWHVVVGQWIVDHRAFPHGDPFSFSMAGAPWIAKEWLSQILYAGAYAVLGWPGLAILAAASVALAFGLLTRWLLEELVPFPVLVFVAAAAALVAPHALARPHVLALPVMVAFVGGLVRAVDRGRAPSLFLLPLLTLWANLHGGFTLGILLIGAFGLDALVLAGRTGWKRIIIAWGRFGLLALIAASITPYGPESMLVTYRILSMGSALTLIGEWRPADFSQIDGFQVCLLVAIAFALHSGFRLRPVRILILLGLLHLALSAGRNTEILGLLLPILIAEPLARAYPGLRRDAEAAEGRPVGLIAGGVLAILLPVTVGLTAFLHYTPAERFGPAAAVAALKAAKAGPVLNDYNFGGYLVFAGVAPFIDGRTELYGGDFTMRYYRAVTLDDLNDFLKILDSYKIGATLLETATPANAFLDRLPGWKRIYGDDVAVVHVRENAATPAE